MFRDCYFEFAGKSSEDFNLMLYFIENDTSKFDSGGKFEIKKDSIPYSYEPFLYGKDYSENPLEFEVEIINPDENITFDEMLQIKNWLFGQDGWRDLVFLNETQHLHLKCILEPLDDITDIRGYTGVRCKIHNASPFWYGDEKEIEISNADLKANVWWDTGHTWDRWCTFKVEIPDNDNVDVPIYPEIIVKPQRNTNTNTDGAYTVGTYFALSNTPALTVTEGKAHTDHKFNIEEDSRVSCSLQYMLISGVTAYTYTEDDGVYSITINDSVVCTVKEEDSKYKISVNGVNVASYNTSDYTNLSESLCKPVVAALNYLGYRVSSDSEAIYAIDTLTVNTKHAIVQSELYPDVFIPMTVNTSLPKPMFRLHYGTNICRIYFGHVFESIKFKYTPLYRLGAL